MVTDQRREEMGLSRFPDAFEGGAIPFFIIYAALTIAMLNDTLIFLLQKLGLKMNTEMPESAETLSSTYADAEEEAPNLGSRVAQLAMTAEEIEDWLPVSLFEASSSSFSCSEGDGASDCVVCLMKFHGGEEIRSLPCDHLFHKNCVDKWLLDYENMTCPLCRRCPVNVAPNDEQHLIEELVM